MIFPEKFNYALIIIISFIVIACSDFNSKTILVQNTTIIDGSGKNRFLGSVRIKDKNIVEIGKITVLETDSIIDGSGMILSPGFIDTHSHHDWDTLRTVDAAISQGITTIIVGQDGRSFLPLEKYYDSLENYPLSTNLGSYVGHGSIRRTIMGDNYKREASQIEIDSMKSFLHREIQSGGLGLGTGLEYDPGIYSSTNEVIQLAKVASEYGGRYISHMRSEDMYLEKSIQEILQIGKEADIPVQISHFKLARRSLWGQASKILKVLDSARNEGIDVTADIYPYEYWQSTMTVLFPKRDFENRESAEFALTELTSPEGMIISDFDAVPEYEGLTLDKIAEIRNEDVITTYLSLIKLSFEMPGESIIAKSMDLKDIKTIIKWPFTNICSDGSSDGHPRGWGAFPRYLSMDSGESLEEKIKKMTFQSAKNLHLDKIGLIRKNFYADLVLFNPNTIKDNATYKKNSLRSSGIEMVIVSGNVVYNNQKPTKKFPGRIVRLNME